MVARLLDLAKVLKLRRRRILLDKCKYKTLKSNAISTENTRRYTLVSREGKYLRSSKKEALTQKIGKTHGKNYDELTGL